MNSPVMALILFCCGLLFLGAMGRSFLRLRREQARFSRIQNETEALLQQRAIPAATILRELRFASLLPGETARLETALRQRENSLPQTAERLGAEQEISRAVLGLVARAEQNGMLSTSSRLTDLLTELQEQEAVLAAIRERYNGAAVRWNASIRFGNSALLGRALSVSFAPLFPGA